jgi:putative GTP pyrophosphokinase
MIMETSISQLYIAKSDFFETERDMPYDIETQRMFNIYNAALQVISTRLSILESDFRVMRKHNPIHHMECRLKSSESILRKLKSRGLDCVLSNITRNIFDVVGLRIVCPYLEDVYKITDLLLGQSDITLLQKKDYIKDPKPNGYRSLHLIVLVPVVLCSGAEQVPVEIQIRTIAMDMWASLEHELCYKANRETDTQTETKLLDCSKKLAAIDAQMGEMYSVIAQSVKPLLLEEGAKA